MPAFVQDVNMALPEDALIDLFVFQLYSPTPVENGALAKLPQGLSDRRLELLTRFHAWLQDAYIPRNPNRPYFVLIPELSVSLNHIDTLQLIAQAGQGSAGVLAGLEFLHWDEYRDLIANMPDMPDHASWTAGGAPNHLVNSALILLNENDGQLRRFVQPKRNPSDGEAATHFPSQNVVLFRSTDQSQGRRLNFCVQICSDFTDHTQVTHLRRQLESVCDGRPIDFTFVLQRNPEQFAPQFQQSVKAYFEPPQQLIDTSHGCLVFSNVASEAHGKSALWGKSMLLFPYAKRWRTPASPTYWLNDAAAYDHQAVVLREPGACIYWLRYKPHYLVNPIAGSGQPGPFPANHALAQSVREETLPVEPSFVAIPPASHWLLAEWLDSKAELLALLHDLPNDVLQHCEDSHDEVHNRWNSLLESNDPLARALLSLFFLCFGSEVLSKDPPEPMLWNDNISRLARRFLSVYCLVNAGLPIGTPVETPGEFEHAHINGGTGLALICGEDKTINSVLVNALRRIDSPAAASMRSTYVLVIVLAVDARTPEELAELVAHCHEQIIETESNEDNITSSNESNDILAVCDQSIWAAIRNAQTAADVETLVMAALGLNS